MRFVKAVAVIALLVPVIGYCAKWEVPTNVTVRDTDKRAAYLEAVDFSYQPTQPVAFSQLKLCIADNISNNTVTLQDSSGSFVGPATGNYYQNTQSQTIQGGGIFKYLDDATSALIATGTTDGGSTALGLTHDIVKFDLKAMTSEAGVTLKFSNVTRAQQYTGGAANDGFNPVGMWRGAGAQRIYASLESVAGRVRACLQ
jgi:hypothetical protein